MALESYTREAREPHTPYGHVRRQKKRIFSVSPQSHSPFSASFQTFCLTARGYLNTKKYGLFCSLRKYSPFLKHQDTGGRGLKLRDFSLFHVTSQGPLAFVMNPVIDFFYL